MCSSAASWRWRRARSATRNSSSSGCASASSTRASRSSSPPPSCCSRAREAELVKLNQIYTRTGDGGEAGLVDGSRVRQAGPRLTAIGEVDEANCAVGLALAELPAGHAVAASLLRIQNELFDLGADLATPGEMEGALRILPSQVTRLEEEIDAMNAGLSPLTSFILPGGSRAVAALHLARAVSRRAERAAV